MPSFLSFDYRAGGTEVVVSRESGVPDLLWLKVQSEWGTDGRSPGMSINVPASVFLSRLHWVAPYCRRHDVGVRWKGAAQDLVQRRLAGSKLLDVALDGGTPLDTDAVDAGLEGSRFIRTLKDFQIRDLGKLLSLPNGANFSVPGAGKTSVAYATYEHERNRGHVDRLLVVSPISAFESWEDEARACLEPVPAIERFSGSIARPTEVLLVNYQRLEAGYRALAEWVASGKTHMILDEAHRMKRGWTGQWGRNCLNLANLAVRRDILTGTPAPQSVFDLDALFDFVWPGQARKLIPSRCSRRDGRPRRLQADRAAVRPNDQDGARVARRLDPNQGPTLRAAPRCDLCRDRRPIRERLSSV